MKLMTMQAAAERIGCSKGHVYNLIAAGRLPRYDIALGPRPVTRVADSDVDAYIESIRQPAPSRTAS